MARAGEYCLFVGQMVSEEREISIYSLKCFLTPGKLCSGTNEKLANIQLKR